MLACLLLSRTLSSTLKYRVHENKRTDHCVKNNQEIKWDDKANDQVLVGPLFVDVFNDLLKSLFRLGVGVYGQECCMMR